MKRNRFILNLAAFAAIVGLLWPTSLAAQDQVTCESDVTVQAEDWLSKIAEKEFGDVLLYPTLQAATNAMAASDDSYTTIDNADVIEPGWKICVPSLEDAQAMMATIQLPSMIDGSPSADADDLTVTELQNATYSGIYDEPITLTDGTYEGEPFDASSASRPLVNMYGKALYGDLNGDGADDGVVFLTESSGGTGNFVYVAAQLNQDGAPVDTGTVLIEDRIQVKSAMIEDGQIKLEIVTEGPGDAACCKSHKAQKVYALQDGTLAEVPSGDDSLVKISAADLNGTLWKLIDFNDDLEPVLSDTEITINFADGQISGSGGCNNYNSGFALSEENPFALTIEPVVATRMACLDPILNQETAYFTALESASQWGYLIGNLRISYMTGDQVFKSLIFEPMSADEAAAAAPAEEAMSESEPGTLDQLTANTWQWVSFTDPGQQFDVESPENYTMTIMPDGNIELVADCNNATASYTVNDGGSITVEPGITTLALCPGESRSEEFLQKLGAAAIYFFQDGNLFIDLFADGGTLEFSPV